MRRSAAKLQLDPYPLVRRSLGISSIDVWNNKSPIDELAKKLSCKGDINDLDTVLELEQLCLELVSGSFPELRVQGIDALFECCTYFDCVGKITNTIIAGEAALTSAIAAEDKAAQRRAHNVVGVCYLRVCDFHRSCYHMEKAYSLSCVIDDPLAKLATLSNAVALLESMGLIDKARDLALKLDRQKHGEGALDLLHLVNANNGIRLSLSVDDLNSAQKFSDIAIRKLATAGPDIGEVHLAHFEAARCAYLVASGDTDVALTLIDKAVEERSAQRNIRATSVLQCARAIAELAKKDRIRIEQSRKALEDLRLSTADEPTLQEEVLRTLLRIATVTRSSKGRRQEALYSQLLRDHLIAVKHKQFFANTSEDVRRSVGGGNVELHNPNYRIPAWTGGISRASKDFRVPLPAESNCIVAEPVNDFAIFNVSRLEAGLRSERYMAAENWTIAAELVSEGNEYHSLHVARLAAAIAKNIGFTAKQCLILELACRLHDIGKIVSAFSKTDYKSLKSSGDYALICEHTNAGEKLLAGSSDPLFELAAKIAKTHHEWWNGTGLPSGLRQEAIPLESRICTMADTFVNLLVPSKGFLAWPVEAAVAQVQAMLGVQLDPGLFAPLVQVLEISPEICSQAPQGRAISLQEDQLAYSRRRLFKVLDLDVS